MLTPAQAAIFKAHVEADPVLSLVVHNSDGAIDIVNAMKVKDASFYVWNTAVSKEVIFGAISWKSMTPADAPDGTQLWANRCLQAQSQQFNLQTMLIGGGLTLNMANQKTRQGLQDALQGLPTGVSGATQDAGWASVRATGYRLANRLEKLFATGTGTTGSPATMVIEGELNHQEVYQIMWGE